MQVLEPVKEFLPLIEEEISAVKTILESNYQEDQSTKIAPLIVFFTSPEHRYCVASSSAEGEFEDVICRISEVLNIYPLINAYSAVISLNTNIDIDGDTFPAVNTFIITYENAWSITVPYSIVDNSIYWMNDHIQVSPVDDLDLDDTSRDMISMFYLYVSIGDVHFTLPELMSYLSTMGCAVNFFDNDPPTFFDFSEEGILTEVDNV